MANTTVKGKFNVVAENGDVRTIYPKTTGDQVLVDRSSNASVIPNDVANLQHIVNKMGSLALKSKVETSDFTTGTMISSLEDLKSNTDTGKIADATVVKDIESRVDTLENSNLVTVDELDAGLATKPDTEINDSVTSTSLTWSSKKLSDQLTTLNSNSNLLKSRVDGLSTLQEGSTTGDAELIDIRTGYDNTIYNTAGNAVRNQINDINNNLLLSKNTIFKNVYNPDDEDIKTGGYYEEAYPNPIWTENSKFFESGYIPCKKLEYYTESIWTETSNPGNPVLFYDKNKNFVTLKRTVGHHIVIPNNDSIAYFRIPMTASKRYSTAIYLTDELVNVFVPYNNYAIKCSNLLMNGYDMNNDHDMIMSCDEVLSEYHPIDIAETENGYLRTDGTIFTDPHFPNWMIKKYIIPQNTNTIYLNGKSTADVNVGYSTYWFVDENDNMISYGKIVSNPQFFINYKVDVPKNAVQLWANVIKPYTKSYIKPIGTDNDIGLGSQWQNKIWYCYGTSISNTNSEGKYPIYLEQMSKMIRVNKGISGGGIGNFGAYSKGQVYNAICNTTDGKLNADLITLETGANDVNTNVPLGTIYDEGTDTLSGCLNDCIRYLQENTTAQICITVSPATKTKPQIANKYYEWANMIEQICHINRVHFLNNDNNMGTAKLVSENGTDYIVDSIHHTNLGGYIMAENLWYQIRNIPVFRTSL